jgi:hypothetical protein
METQTCTINVTRWKELYWKENISKILVKLMSNIYETQETPSGWKKPC